MSVRIAQTFASLAAQNRPAIIPFIMAGDDSMERTAHLLEQLPLHGADIIELGMPFSDPSADGLAIQAAATRALSARTTLSSTLAAVRHFRNTNATTPIVLMGYYNPIFHYGVDRFASDAAEVGVDGVIIVDLPPEEEDELKPFLTAKQIDFIRLIAPTTDEARLSTLLTSATGFVYTISIKGITGAASAQQDALNARIQNIKQHTQLPVVAGFGIREPQQAQALAGIADGVVIGSALVDCIYQKGDQAGLEFIQSFANSLPKK